LTAAADVDGTSPHIMLLLLHASSATAVKTIDVLGGSSYYTQQQHQSILTFHAIFDYDVPRRW
jgi:hypothetical protein